MLHSYLVLVLDSLICFVWYITLHVGIHWRQKSGCLLTRHPPDVYHKQLLNVLWHHIRL